MKIEAPTIDLHHLKSLGALVHAKEKKRRNRNEKKQKMKETETKGRKSEKKRKEQKVVTFGWENE